MNFLQNKIAKRLLLYLGLFGVLITLLSVVGHVVWEYRKDVAAIDDRLEIVRVSNVGSIGNALWTLNDKAIQTQLEGIVSQPDIAYAVIKNDENETLHAVGALPEGRLIRQEYPLVYVYRDRDHQLGTLEVVASLVGIEQRMIDQAINILVIEAVKVFMLASFIFLVVQFVITRHLATLAEYARSFRLADFPENLEIRRVSRVLRGPDELDELVAAINDMRRKLKKTYDDLVGSHEVLLRAQHVAHIGNWNWNLVTGVTTWSDELYSITGISQEEYDGTYEMYLSCIHPEDQQQFKALTARIVADKAPYHEEYRIVCKDDGQTRYVQEDGIVSIDAAGKITNIMGTIQDITERKRAEVELANSKALLECLIHSIPDLIFYKDRDSVYLGGNRAFCAFTGHPEEDIVGKTDFDFFPQDVAQFFREKDQEMLRSGEPKTNEEWVDYPDGRRVLLETLKTPFYGPGGEVLGLIGISRDLTTRKLMEVRLEKSEEKFRQLAENIQEVFWIISRKSKSLQYVSQAYETIWGRTCQSLFADPMAVLESIVPEDRERVTQAIGDNPQEKMYLPEFRISRPDGSLRWISARIFPVHDARGDVYRYAGIAEDISERKRNEEALRQSQKMEAMGTLAGGIAHDFNNILTAILGFSELALLYMPEEGSVRDSIEQVRLAGNRAKELVKQILSFSRQSEASRSPQELTVLVKETLKLLRASLPVNIAISQDIAPDVGLILADITQIHQVLMNLCTNAAHGMAEHGGTLTIGIHEVAFAGDDEARPRELAPGTYVRLTVRDTGTGIPRRVLEHIFEPYFTTKAMGQGTGLGLSVVHGIVADHGGVVLVSSTVGVGTCFDVFFPKVTVRPLAPEKIDQKPYIGTESILLVDDEEAIVKMGQRMLEGVGYQVTIAASGEEGLAIFQAQPDAFQVVITDQTMPGMSGAEMAQQLLEIKPDQAIILCTGYSTSITAEKAKAVGIRDFAMKPLSGQELARLIRGVLDAD
ncbi:MAG: PAS domain S-box protein [Proteobacteria bacterium]|nr:PAS domain S-box protein [Pseudomonadota bacterium]MBU1641502.1 PAS domain S-box protein [Pseudomonadota bacterium]